MPERVQVCAGALILSMRCTHPGSNRGLTELSYLVCLFLPRRLRVLAVNLRFAILFPRLLPPVLDLDLLGRVRRGSPVGRFRQRWARKAVDDSGDLRP